MHPFEKLGEKFNPSLYQNARKRCIEVVDAIAGAVTEGMAERDGQALVKELFNKAGVTKFWHPTKFRIAADTTKSFRELPDASLVTRLGDLFFVDVGPVFDEHEADFGRTYELGASVKPPLIEASEKLWDKVREKWRVDELTGEGLYRFAAIEAEKLGYELNMNMDGHRLGDFPHALFCKAGLGEIDFKPSPELWILEIHILDRSAHRGAFFEDIL